MKILNLILIISLVILSSCSKEEKITQVLECNIQGHANIELQNVLDKYVSKGLPGISVVYHKDDVTYSLASGLASLENEIELKPCHLFHSASLAKTYFSALSFRLAEENLINLESNIKNYLPESYLELLPPFDSISVHSLLDHSSGLPDFYTTKHVLDYFDNLHQKYSVEEMLGFLKKQELIFTPGSNANYSNTNYLLVALIMDHLVENKNHVDLFYEYLVDPLNLEDTFYDISRNVPDRARITDCYFDYYGDGYLQNCTQVEYNFAEMNIGHDGIVATPSDYFTFFFALMKGDFLTEDSLEKLLQARQYEDFLDHLSEGSGVRLAHDENGKVRRIGHFGATLGAANAMLYYPEEDCFLVVCSNFGRYLDCPLSTLFTSEYDEFRLSQTLLGDLEAIITN